MSSLPCPGTIVISSLGEITEDQQRSPLAGDIKQVSDDSGQLIFAPEIKASELVAWIYHPQTPVKVSGPSHQIMSLPEPRKLQALVQMALDQNYSWVLLDGPRAQRTDWMLDIWWEDRPEMPARLLEQTQARSLSLVDLLAAIDEYVQT